MQKLILNYGIIAGVIVSAMLLVMFTGIEIDLFYGQLLGYSSMIIAFSTIFFAIRSHRDKNLDGEITFGKAFLMGLGVTLVASALYVIAWMIISNTIGKDFMANYYQQTVEQLKSSDLSETEIATKIKEMDTYVELYKNPIMKIGITFLEIFPVGLIISIIAALILRKET